MFSPTDAENLKFCWTVEGSSFEECERKGTTLSTQLKTDEYGGEKADSIVPTHSLNSERWWWYKQSCGGDPLDLKTGRSQKIQKSMVLKQRKYGGPHPNGPMTRKVCKWWKLWFTTSLDNVFVPLQSYHSKYQNLYHRIFSFMKKSGRRTAISSATD